MTAAPFDPELAMAHLKNRGTARERLTHAGTVRSGPSRFPAISQASRRPAPVDDRRIPLKS